MAAMMASTGHSTKPSGISSLLDTDLYKLTMQNAVLKHFPDVQVAYKFTNRTAQMRLNQKAYDWLKGEINKLGTIVVTESEIAWLKENCPYFKPNYLTYLKGLRLNPAEQVEMSFVSASDGFGELSISIHGLWVDTIIYEIPLLALTSEAYFKFVDTDWTHDGQVEKAYEKGSRLLQAGVVFSEFGSRRRRDLYTHSCVMQGLIQAAEDGKKHGWKGKLSGTSNVYLAKQFNTNPVGTVAHEWFMGIAALTNDYTRANEAALRYWVATYGPGVLGIALTDTFGTADFLKAFARPIPQELVSNSESLTYAQAFTGVRQDSGDPLDFLKVMQAYYKSQNISDKKSVIYSDSLDVDKCIEYKAATEEADLMPSFGVGTHFTNDFVRLSTKEKSVPLNIVIKLSEAEGRSAVKLSDNEGKNMGPKELVEKVKHDVGYTEKAWSGVDEAHRWDAK